MQRNLQTFIATLFLALLTGVGSAESPTEDVNFKDGQVQKSQNHEYQAWDALSKKWLGPEAFWYKYAERRGGLTWGRAAKYPPYAKVREFDTFIVELNSGPCLMEFFHSRWRRANDVRRWDDEFNRYGGCPHVFD